MRIGLINELRGRVADSGPRPSWGDIHERAVTAERAGFDMFVYEDALLYRSESDSAGVWESMAISGALAATTSTIRFGQSVVNSPYRNPALTASTAETINEISGGRYVLGIGAGNTDDYEAFGYPADHRYSRFAEAIEIIHSLLRTGSSSASGSFHSTDDAELVLRGSAEVPIVIAGGGPKMLRLAARFADAWNWWAYGQTPTEGVDTLGPLIAQLDEACAEHGRDPSTLERTLDLYSVVAPGHDAAEFADQKPISGSAEEIAAGLLVFEDAGFAEVRCNVLPQTVDAVASMADVVELVHRG